ncbi:MAG: hypothetical protein WCZ27_02170 [Tissierellaceae bacterium]
MKFSKKLDFLMNITKTTNSGLARYISLDPSYISRLRNGKRRAPANAEYMEEIASYFTKKLRKGDRDEDFLVYERALYNWLLDDSHPIENIPGIFDGEFIEKLGLTLDQEDKKERESRRASEEIQLFYGIGGKREAVSIFLSKILESKAPQTLYLFSDEGIEWLSDDPGFFKDWFNYMVEIIKRGNRIRIIHTVSRDFDEMITAIRAWMPLYMTGAIESYYYPKKRDGIVKRTLFIAPNTAALVSSSIGNMESQVPSTLVFNDKAIESYEIEYNNYQKLCRPLMKLYNQKTQLDYQKLLERLEKSRGATILESGGLSILSMPVDLGQDLVNRASDSLPVGFKDDIGTRIREFEKKLADDQIIEIIRLPGEEEIKGDRIRLGLAHLMAREEIYYSREDFILHLENIIGLLEGYENYHIIISKDQAEGDFSILIKEGLGVIVSRQSPPPVSIKIDESNIVAAVWDYLDYEFLLGDLSQERKHKSIGYLRAFIEKISRQGATE